VLGFIEFDGKLAIHLLCLVSFDLDNCFSAIGIENIEIGEVDQLFAWHL
jgi:hypothetical protein